MHWGFTNEIKPKIVTKLNMSNKNQLPMLPGNPSKVCECVVGFYPLSGHSQLLVFKKAQDAHCVRVIFAKKTIIVTPICLVPILQLSIQ